MERKPTPPKKPLREWRITLIRAKGQYLGRVEADGLPGALSGFSVCLCGCHLVSGQAGALDRLLHQSRGLGLFDKFADVGEPRGLTFRNYHAD
jgi:hypothetical protein